MELVARLVALLLAGVFAAAAATKWADRPATARSFRALELRSPYRLAWLVPATEAVLAGLLVLWPPLGAAGALVLLGAFSALIGRRLAAGVHVPCACFGGGGGPLSWRHLARNGALAAAAVVVLVGLGGGRGGGGWARWGWLLLGVGVVLLAALAGRATATRRTPRR